MAIPALNRWMGSLPDSVKISQISMPGTHNSCATVAGGGLGFAQNQTETIDWQLNNGIRYLDIRCANAKRPPFNRIWFFKIFHGIVDQKISFDKVLDKCLSFLSRNPTETIIMRVQQEYSNDSDKYKEIFQRYLNRKGRSKFYLGTTMPTLGTVRGKIVLLTLLPFIEGLWFSNQEIQDDYDAPTYLVKKEKVREHIINSMASTVDKLYINHLSATAPLLLRTPWNYAQDMNKYGLYLARDVHRHGVQIGVIVCDYAGASNGVWNEHDTLLQKAVIERNTFLPPPTGNPNAPHGTETDT